MELTGLFETQQPALVVADYFMLPQYIIIKDGIVIRQTPQTFEGYASQAQEILKPDNSKGEYMYTAGGMNKNPEQPVDWVGDGR